MNEGEDDPFENEQYANEAFDSPSVEYPRDNDLVDISTLEGLVSSARKRLPALRSAKLAAEKAKILQASATIDPASITPQQSSTSPTQS